MPLKNRSTAKLRSRVLARTPPRVLVARRGDTAFTVMGYLKQVLDAAVDELGNRVSDGFLFLADGVVQAGDVVDGYTVWYETVTNTLKGWVIQREPNWQTWVRRTAGPTTYDVDTGEPINTELETVVEAQLSRFSANIDNEMSGSNREHSAIFVCKAQVVVGDKLSRPDRQQFTIIATAPYGPYQKAYAVAS